MTFWPKLKRLALACCIALALAIVLAALLDEDAAEPDHTSVEN